MEYLLIVWVICGLAGYTLLLWDMSDWDKPKDLFFLYLVMPTFVLGGIFTATIVFPMVLIPKIFDNIDYILKLPFKVRFWIIRKIVGKTPCVMNMAILNNTGAPNAWFNDERYIFCQNTIVRKGLGEYIHALLMSKSQLTLLDVQEDYEIDS